MARKHRFESPSLQYLYDKHIKGNAKLQAVYEEELINATLARELYKLRKGANLAQSELAKLAHTTPSVISRLEDPNYQGHSLTMVARIAGIVGKQVQITFVPKKQIKGSRSNLKRSSLKTNRERRPSASK